MTQYEPEIKQAILVFPIFTHIKTLCHSVSRATDSPYITTLDSHILSLQSSLKFHIIGNYARDSKAEQDYGHTTGPV